MLVVAIFDSDGDARAHVHCDPRWRAPNLWLFVAWRDSRRDFNRFTKDGFARRGRWWLTRDYSFRFNWRIGDLAPKWRLRVDLVTAR